MPCGGEEMNVWFNRSPTVFHRGTLDSYEDVKGIEESMSAILEHITASGQEYKQVIVGGFSMGGGLALYLLGRSYLPDSLRGVFSMGSFIIDGTSLFQQPRDGGSSNNKISVFMMHGTNARVCYFSYIICI